MPVRLALRQGEAGAGAENPAGRAVRGRRTAGDHVSRSGSRQADILLFISREAARVRLEVECIEAELRDLGLAWQAATKPVHKIVDGEAAQPPAKALQNTN